MFNEDIRKCIDEGTLPAGVSLDEIRTALKETAKPNSFEVFGFLSAKHTRKGSVISDELVSCQKVTTAFAAYLVDSLQNSTTHPMDVFKYHASGTGTAAEDNTDTTLGTEVETRDIGTQIEGASINIFKTVATHTYAGSFTIGEHGLFSASSGGTMLDRSKLTAAIPVIATDQIEWTYELTVNAET